MSNPIGSFLKGVRVLDLSQYIPGPLGSLMLVDMGADVIKIEPPSGDPMRDLGPRDQAGEALFHRRLHGPNHTTSKKLRARCWGGPPHARYPNEHGRDTERRQIKAVWTNCAR